MKRHFNSLKDGDTQFSKLIAGTMRMTCWGKQTLTPQEALDFIKKCVSYGINTFDTADIYGYYTVEHLLGQALSLEPDFRSKIKIITKCGINLVCDNRPNITVKSYDCTTEHILLSVNNSLQALRTTYIDLLLIHRPDPFTHPTEIANAFHKLKQDNKVMHFGVSNYKPSQWEALQHFLGEIPLITNQIQFSVFYTEPLYDGTFDHIFKVGITPQVWSPLGGSGKLLDENSTDEIVIRLRKVLIPISQKYGVGLDGIALAWVLNHPSQPSAVIGTTNYEHLDSLNKATNLKLTRFEWYTILHAAQGKEVD